MEQSWFANSAATRDWVVGFHAPDMDAPTEHPRYSIRRLADREAGPLQLDVVAGRHFSPTLVFADDATVYFVGRQCDAGSSEDPATEHWCDDGAVAGYAYDPQERTTTPMTVDDSLSELVGVSLTAAQRTDDGWDLVGVRFEGDQSGTDPSPETVVVRAQPDSLMLLSRWSGSGATCTTGESSFRLDERVPSEGGVELSEPAELSLIRVPHGGGGEKIPLPDVAAEFGGANVALGCTEHGPVLFASDVDPAHHNPRAYEMADGGRWIERDEWVPEGAVRPERVLSDRGGVVVVWETGDPRDREETLVAIPNRRGEVRHLAAFLGTFWRGSSGSTLRWVTEVDPNEASGGPRTQERFPGLVETTIWNVVE